MIGDVTILAAVIAFGACFLAVAAVSKADPRARRRGMRAPKGGVVGTGVTSLQGPRTKQWLASAGYFRDDAALVYMATSAGSALVGGCLGGLAASWVELGTIGVLSFAAAGVFLFSRLPATYINSRWTQRSRQIAGSFPLMLDMLEVCANAGMSLDEAWSVVRGQLQVVCPPLVEEMELVELEVRLGQSRIQALQSLAERTGVGDASALATLLEQSERLGSGLAETFRGQASAMRQDYALSLEENAHRMSVTAILPVALLMAPAFFVVTVLPMGIVIVRTLSGLNN